MSDKTHIEWTDATWNIITGCTLVSEGCRHCYAATLAATRLKHIPSRVGLARINAAGEAKFTGEVRFNEHWLDQPLGWKKPRRIFVCAHGDLFHESVPDEWIDKVFAVMALAPQHTFQVLTKRPERARQYLTDSPNNHISIRNQIAGRGPHVLRSRGDAGHMQPLPNVWLGTSVEDQATADERIPHLLATPAAVRFVSAEPLLGPVDLTWAFPDIRTACCHVCGFRTNAVGGVCPNDRSVLRGDIGLDWLIVGGESGPGARPMHPDWARSLRDQCQAAGVAFFMKQWGMWAPTERLNNLGIPSEGYVHPHGSGAAWPRPAPPGWGEHGPGKLDELGFRHMTKVGKKAAGRLLDGREWNEMPGVK